MHSRRLRGNRKYFISHIKIWHYSDSCCIGCKCERMDSGGLVDFVHRGIFHANAIISCGEADNSSRGWFIFLSHLIFSHQTEAKIAKPNMVAYVVSALHSSLNLNFNLDLNFVVLYRQWRMSEPYPFHFGDFSRWGTLSLKATWRGVF